MKLLNLLSVFVILSFFSFSSVVAQNSGKSVLGTWLNEEGEAHIEVTQSGGQFFGKIIWLKEPIDPDTGKPKTDKENADPKLKSRPLIGLALLKDFTFNEKKNEWSGGKIYDPKSGKTYDCYMVLQGKDRLKIRGYIGVSLIGRTTYWTRVK